MPQPKQLAGLWTKRIPLSIRSFRKQCFLGAYGKAGIRNPEPEPETEKETETKTEPEPKK